MLEASSTDEHLFGEDDYFVSRLTGFFVPPRTGEYEFLIHSNDAGELMLGITGTSELVSKLLFRIMLLTLMHDLYVNPSVLKPPETDLPVTTQSAPRKYVLPSKYYQKMLSLISVVLFLF